MRRKWKLILITITILLLAGGTISAIGSRNVPLAQMDMPTDTVQPEPTLSTPVPQVQDTPTPAGADLEGSAPSPTWTSIFTGYTPYPNTTSTYYPMGGSAMGGGCGGMSGGGMDSGTMGMGTGYTTNGTPMGSMGSMGGMGSMGSMDSSSCTMMSGMNMSGASSMGGMDMSGGYMISGMDMSGTGSYVQDNSASLLDNPWLLIGWVILGLLILAILVGAGIGIAWLIRHSRRLPSA